MEVNSQSICRTIPTYAPTHQGYSAVITGSNGISGFHTLRVLLQSPACWKNIYALSRRPPPPNMMKLLPEDQRSRVKHVACDFLESPEDISRALKSASVVADYVFFYSYLQPPPKDGQPIWSNAEELCKVNSALLRNFLDALPLANITPKRFLLQTGAKYYGAHLGTIRSPAVESDPRVDIEPNFYYAQEDMLMNHCRVNSGTGWNILRPSWIIGATENAQMNALHPFGVYAAVQANLRKPLAFPGDFATWQSLPYHSSAIMTGHLSEWVVLEDNCRNESFNSVDTSPLPWNRFWPELGRWFGIQEIGRPLEEEQDMISIIGKNGKDTPLGYGPPSVHKFAFTLTNWAKEPENVEAWKEIMDTHKLTHNPFDDVEAHFPFADGSLMAAAPLSLNKARRYGWTGYVDTLESIWVMFNEMSRLRMLPPMQVNDPRPCI